MGLARGGISDDSVKTSLMRGRLPSTLPVPAMCGCDGQNGGPTKCKGGGARCARRGRHRPSAATCEDEGGCFGTPPATDFDAKDGEMAPPASNKLKVRPLLGSTGNLEGCPCCAAVEAAWSTRGAPVEVNGDLGSMPKGEAVGNDLYSSLFGACLAAQARRSSPGGGRAAGRWLLLRGKCGLLLARGACHGNVPQSAGMPRHGQQGRPSHDGIGKLQVQGAAAYAIAGGAAP